MLLTNQRLDKLAALQLDFTRRGMLSGTCFSAAMDALGKPNMCTAVPVQINQHNEDIAAGATATAPACTPAHVPTAPPSPDLAAPINIDENLEIDNGPTVLQAFVQLAKIARKSFLQALIFH